MGIVCSEFRTIKELNEYVISCRRCPRLAKYIVEVAKEKVRRYRDWEYWGKPLPGFGDSAARILIIGLAPAAHGGNRTGRMFTGDDSGQWLARALYESGFATKPLSVSRDDGFTVKDVYITAVVRCAPPGNKPTVAERKNCIGYLSEELRLLSGVRVILTLGKFAFDSYLSLLKLPSGFEKPRFRHGEVHYMGPSNPVLLCSYHPSKQNTQTGKLTWQMWISVFYKARELLKQH